MDVTASTRRRIQLVTGFVRAVDGCLDQLLQDIRLLGRITAQDGPDIELESQPLVLFSRGQQFPVHFLLVQRHIVKQGIDIELQVLHGAVVVARLRIVIEVIRIDAECGRNLQRVVLSQLIELGIRQLQVQRFQAEAYRQGNHPAGFVSRLLVDTSQELGLLCLAKVADILHDGVGGQPVAVEIGQERLRRLVAGHVSRQYLSDRLAGVAAVPREPCFHMNHVFRLNPVVLAALAIEVSVVVAAAGELIRIVHPHLYLPRVQQMQPHQPCIMPLDVGIAIAEVIPAVFQLAEELDRCHDRIRPYAEEADRLMARYPILAGIHEVHRHLAQILGQGLQASEVGNLSQVRAAHAVGVPEEQLVDVTERCAVSRVLDLRLYRVP